MNIFVQLLSKTVKPESDEMPFILREVSLTGTSINEAENLASNGKWEDAAHIYYTLGKFIDVAQMLININKFDQAEKMLQMSDHTVEKLPAGTPSSLFLKAQIAEKRGWIDDYVGRFDDEISHFGECLDLLMQIPEAQRPQGAASTMLTARHFTARAYIQLAAMEKNVETNIQEAKKLLEENLSYYRTLTANNTPQPVNEAFEESWLARCNLISGDVSGALQHLTNAKSGFDAHVTKFPESGILAHYWTTKGIIHVYAKDVASAREAFTNAITVYKTTETYPRGEAVATLGLAACDALEGKSDEATAMAQSAVNISPSIISFAGI